MRYRRHNTISYRERKGTERRRLTKKFLKESEIANSSYKLGLLSKEEYKDELRLIAVNYPEVAEYLNKKRKR